MLIFSRAGWPHSYSIRRVNYNDLTAWSLDCERRTSPQMVSIQLTEILYLYLFYTYKYVYIYIYCMYTVYKYIYIYTSGIYPTTITFNSFTGCRIWQHPPRFPRLISRRLKLESLLLVSKKGAAFRRSGGVASCVTISLRKWSCSGISWNFCIYVYLP